MAIGWGVIIGLVLAIMVLAVLFWVLKKVLPLILNGIIGLVVFWLLNYFGVMSVPLDIWTFLISAIGGVFGIVIVLALRYFGVPL